MRVPAGFLERRAGSIVLVLDASLDPAIELLGVLEADAWERLDRAGGGGEGRLPTVILEPPDAERLLVRRLLHGGLLGPLLGTWFLGRARPLRELAGTAQLRERGAPVPRPAFAWAERRIGPLYRAAVATFLVEDSLDALRFLEEKPSAARIQRAAAAAGRAVRRLHDAGGRHADLQVKNLLLREDEGETECIVVDLDRIRVGSSPGPRRRMHELMRLLRSLLKRDLLTTVGARGVARFFGSYVGRDRELRRALRAHLRKERLRLTLHALLYPGRRSSAG